MFDVLILFRPRICLFLAFFLLTTTLANAGAWVEKKGAATVYFTFGRQFWDHVYNDYGDRTPTSLWSQSILSVLAEVGVAENLTLGLHSTLYSLSGSESMSGVSAVEIQARSTIFERGRTIISLQPLLVIPGGFQTTSGSVNSKNAGLDAELRGLLGSSFDLGSDLSVFLNFEAAYRKRFGIPSDEARVAFTLGAKPWQRWIGFVQLFDTQPLGPNPDLTTNYALTEWSLSAGRELNARLTAALSYTEQISGRAALSGTGWFASVWYKF